jgi:hypothetical protein
MSTGSRLLTLVGLALLTGSLGGCGAINANLAAGVSDTLPHWAGGLPPDAPPRPGSAKYEEFMRERERKRLEAAPPKDEAGTTPAASLGVVY